MSLLLPWLTGGPDTRLSGRRVILEAPRRRHYAQWARVRGESRDHLEPFEPQWAWDELTRAAYRRRLRRYDYERREAAGFAYLVLRKQDRALVGGVTLSNIRRGVTQTASVGYWVGQPYVRQGYASEALGLVLHLAFRELGLHRVEAACMPHNLASIGVLERAGFQHEGRARRYLKINGHWEDHLLFARLAEDTTTTRRTRRDEDRGEAKARGERLDACGGLSDDEPSREPALESSASGNRVTAEAESRAA